MTKWFDKKPGESNLVNIADVSDEVGGPALLMQAGKPDWIKHPVSGEMLRCISKTTEPVNCPMCKVSVIAPLFKAEGGLCAIDCTACKQFVWFEVKEKEGA